MRTLFTVVLATALPLTIFAQSDQDALRYSLLDFGGTARSLGSGNAYGALGGNFSSLSMNPAGLGIYRSSEFVITPGLLSTSDASTYLGTSTGDSKYNFHLSNFGLVFAKLNPGKEHATDDWVGGAFAIGYNRLANFNNSVSYTGYNNTNSLMNTYVDYLNANGGTNPSDAYDKDPFGAGLAWETYLINPTPWDSTEYYSVITDGRVQQTKTIETKGAIDEMVLSFAGNYGNRLYIGLTIGIPNIHYKNISYYSEEDVQNVHPDFNSFTLGDITETSGLGINAKFGIIYRINDFLRIGGAVHSPTLYQLHDDYYSSMSSVLDTTGSFSYDSPVRCIRL